MTARRLHRGIAAVLALFLALHLANHLAGLAGQDLHRRVMETLRQVYRAPGAEAVLIAAFAAQAGLGLRLWLRHRRLTLQTLSGAYLALFLILHIGAVMVARAQGVETDLGFAAAGMQAPGGLWLVFAPYYGLAIMALAAHLATGPARRHPALRRAILLAGAAIAAALVALLAGLVTPVTVSPAQMAPFAG